MLIFIKIYFEILEKRNFRTIFAKTVANWYKNDNLHNLFRNPENNPLKKNVHLIIMFFVNFRSIFDQ